MRLVCFPYKESMRAKAVLTVAEQPLLSDDSSTLANAVLTVAEKPLLSDDSSTLVGKRSFTISFGTF